MTLNLITLATVKIQLGLSDTSYDADITAMIPIVSADVRRILNYQYDEIMGATYTSGSTAITLGDVSDFTTTWVPLGTVLVGTGIPDDTYLASYDSDTAEYTMSADATDTDDEVNPTINISQWPAISKMVWYKISKQNTTSADEKATTSESIGSISLSYTPAEINSKWNYPQVLIDDLGTSFTEVG